MTIKFKGVKKPFADCIIKDDPPHTAERARWSDGWWSDLCTRHMEIFKKNSQAVKAKANPLWFLRGKKETVK